MDRLEVAATLRRLVARYPAVLVGRTLAGRPPASRRHPRRHDRADAAIAHAEEVGGLTMQLAHQVAPAVRAGRLSVVLAEFEPLGLPIHLVYPTSRLLSANVRTLVEATLRRRGRRFTKL